MLEKLLKDWKGELQIDDKHYTSVQSAESVFKTLSANTHIVLHSAVAKENQSTIDELSEKIEYRITVKKYMTESASPSFDFMTKWNKNIPMPLRTMTGTIEKETRGMVYMNLHGFGQKTITCTCCGKELTNPISRYYGIGPICLGKLGIVNPIDDIENIKEQLEKIEWSGWIIKSSIVEREEIIK